MHNMPSLCRICLVDDGVQLRSIVDTHLHKTYESLTFMPFVTEDRRPVMVCNICCAKLDVCYQLRRSCLRSENLFNQMLQCVVQVQLQKISSDVYLNRDDVIERSPTICYKDEVKQEHIEVAEQYPLEDDYLQPSNPENDSSVLVMKIELGDNVVGPSVVKKPTPVQRKPHEDISTEKLKKTERNRANTEQPKIETSLIVADKAEQGNKVVEACNKVETPIHTQQSKKPFTHNCVISENKINGNRNIQNDSSKKYLCDTCRKCFRTNRELIIHIRTHTGEKPYSCDICKKCFSGKGGLDTHIRTHTGEKPYSCDICKKCFSQKCTFNKHIRTHTGEKPYSCDICKKCFSGKGGLDTHIRTHTGEKPYSCDICKKCFSHKPDLYRHIHTHTGEKPYSCDICKKCFSGKAGLDIHIRTHTGEKPYSCDICKKCFSHKPNLDQHIRTHTGEKPYSCDICKKCFSQKCDLDRHIQAHTGEKPYRCDICKKCFSRKGTLDTHIRTHTGKKPYSCNICKKCFSDNSSFNRHIRTHAGAGEPRTVCK